MRFMLSILLPDRVGILRDVTAILADLGGNIDAISQTVVAGHFTMALTASFPERVTEPVLRTALMEALRRDAPMLGIRPYTPAAAARPGEAERFIVTLSGPDRAGILKTVTAFLAAREINIHDWYVVFTAPTVTHVGEVAIPDSLDLAQVQAELAALLAPMGLAATVQHENIFRATNEIGPINSLLAGRNHAAD